MSSPVTETIDSWLPRQLPAQLTSLGALYRAALEMGGEQQAASVGWRLYAVLAFAARMAPLPRLAELTGLTVEQLTTVLADFSDDDPQLTAAA